MTAIDVDTLHRTVLLELNDGRAVSLADAVEVARQYRLQVVVAADLVGDPTAQAALFTAVNVGRRAFIGGVTAVIPADARVRAGWGRGQTVRDTVRRLGASLAAVQDPIVPSLIIGDVASIASRSVWATWHGWSAGAVTDQTRIASNDGAFGLAGVLASGLAVSELFQAARGSVVPTRRDVGLSLWDPAADWRDAMARGPRCEVLPGALWLAGLGHLGQANAWAVGTLPYASDAVPKIWLQDVDEVTVANESTSVLSHRTDRGIAKVRVVGSALEGLGFDTRMVERRFDGSTSPAGEEARCLLTGFDRPEPRTFVGSFPFAVDAGIGSTALEYLDIVVHAFPSDVTPQVAFGSSRAADRTEALVSSAAYVGLVDEMVRAGATEFEARCAVVKVANRAVGAAFVGSVASSIALGEVLRELHDGRRTSVQSLSLRHPEHRSVVSTDVRRPAIQVVEAATSERRAARRAGAA